MIQISKIKRKDLSNHTVYTVSLEFHIFMFINSILRGSLKFIAGN